MIAALYVERGGVYWDLEGVDPWDKERDARLYAGPHPVVAHPPCERWGRYWYGGPMLHAQGRRKKLGDDGGCFSAALHAVRMWGGVLEHPESSKAWGAFGLIPPLRGGGWSVADDRGGWTCCVEQGHYGHRARKATWLYAARVALPRLTWGPARGRRPLDDGFHSKRERDLVRNPPADMSAADRALRERVIAYRASRGLGDGEHPVERMATRERAATPIPFRDLLLGIARSARRLDMSADSGR